MLNPRTLKMGLRARFVRRYMSRETTLSLCIRWQRNARSSGKRKRLFVYSSGCLREQGNVRFYS